jgi:alpha-1,3-rhamnosyl/mannosyltransferase
LLPRLLKCDPSNEYVLFLDTATEADLEGLAVRSVRPRTSVSQAGAASARGRRSLRDLWAMGRAVAREQLDLMYFPSVYSYFPVLGRVPVAVAFHDAIAEHHGRLVFPTRSTRWMWKLKASLARYQARGILTVSDWSRDALAEWFGIPRDRIFVTPEAPSAIFEPAPDPSRRRVWLREHGLPSEDPYLIYVGGFNPHKNLGTLLQAFGDHVQKDADSWLRLLLVGDYAGDVFHADVATLREQIVQIGLEERVHFAGFVPDEDLRHLYSGALACVLVSLEEGFGLPAVEAAACNTPCLATRNSPLPDLLAGGGVFVAPDDRNALREGIDRLVSDPMYRDRLAATARERARALSWSATAEATRRALVSLARAKR